MDLKATLDDLRMQQAADWLQRLREGDHQSHPEFVAWLSESPSNMKAFLTMDALTGATRAALKSMPSADRAALLSNAVSKVVELTGASAPTNRMTMARGGRVLGRPHRVWALAASMGLIAFVTWQFAVNSSSTNYVTGASQQRTIDLADGSIVYLNTNSEISIRMGDSERLIQLTRGEALFNVARDARRPFRVSTRDAMVEAVGTQFNVNTGDGGTHIAVVEGKVKVSRDRDSASTSGNGDVTGLSAGETAEVTHSGHIERHSGIDVQRAVAWSQPELIFQGTALEEAVQQFNRHRRATPLRLIDVQPGSHHYTGVFNATDADSFAALLALEPDLIIEKRSDEIAIRARK